MEEERVPTDLSYSLRHFRKESLIFISTLDSLLSKFSIKPNNLKYCINSLSLRLSSSFFKIQLTLCFLLFSLFINLLYYSFFYVLFRGRFLILRYSRCKPPTKKCVIMLWISHFLHVQIDLEPSLYQKREVLLRENHLHKLICLWICS